MDASDYTSLPDMFLKQAKEHPDRLFLSHKQDDGHWSQNRTWSACAAEITGFANGLKRLGVQAGERLVICSENRPEWVIMHLAVMVTGAIPVPAYTTNTVSDHKHILSDSGAVAVLTSTRALAKRIMPAVLEAPDCRFFVSIEPVPAQENAGIEKHTFDAVRTAENGPEQTPDAPSELPGLTPDDTAVIIYTSGTGGTPKGVMLSHRAVLTNCMGAYEVISDWETGHERFLSFLPLSHAYEHMGGLFLPVTLGATIYFAESVDQLVPNMARVKPTVMTAVPRLHEAIRTKILRALEKGPARSKRLFEKTLALGRKKFEGETLSLKERIQDRALELLVRRKVRARFGGQLKALVSGGAALNYEVALFFESIGITILQGYGQTEAAPLLTVNRRNLNKPDTVGPAVRGVTLKIAGDGEILARGDNLMQGYWRNEAATAETIKDGWLHTGDIGRLDADGYLKITDRKKDIIVLTGGDNVSPARVEGFLTLEPEIGQVMVYGDKKPHLVALIVPDQEFLTQWAKDAGKGTSELAALADDKDLHKAVGDAVARVNQTLANTEKVRRFCIATEEFTTENALMTPSLKVKRHPVTRVYQTQLDALYAKP